MSETDEAKATPAFTSGPWKAGIDGNLRVYGPDGRGTNSGLIASFVRRADVTLVAAAPDLYAALKEIDAAWATEGFEGPDSAKSKLLLSDHNLAMWRAARAALAKAAGREEPKS